MKAPLTEDEILIVRNRPFPCSIDTFGHPYVTEGTASRILEHIEEDERRQAQAVSRSVAGDKYA